MWCIPEASAEYVACMEDVLDQYDRWERRHEVFDSEKEKLVKDLEYIKKNIAGQNTLQAKIGRASCRERV